MRVLHLTRDFPPHHCGGISTAVAGLAHASLRAGLAVAVLSFDAWRPSLPGAARAAVARQAAAAGEALPVLRLTTPDDLPDARAFAAAWRPDVLHVHDGMLWPFAADLRSALRAPAVFTVHVAHRAMNALRGVPHTASLAAQELALADADAVLFPSAAARAAVAQPSSAHRAVEAPLGVDDSDAARAARVGERARLLLAVGRFDDVKGTPELFAVLRAALRRLPDANAVIAGDLPANPRAAERWRARWERDTSAALRARVHFAGWLAPAALAAQYARAAVVIVPSRFETFGLVPLEAMLHGAAVAATDAGALPELITHDVTGLLSPVGDVARLTEHVVALVEDPTHAARLAAAAAAEVRARWLWEHRLPAVRSAYEA
ncbi:MAG: glycosyltransferase family 4 protein [Deltaproteobacteria bacterium]|nr:glycosyltransferase family 4 protein [Deltaproteobacteria bacterium]